MTNKMAQEVYVVGLMCKQNDLHDSLRDYNLTTDERASIKKEIKTVTDEIIKINNHETYSTSTG